MQIYLQFSEAKLQEKGTTNKRGIPKNIKRKISLKDFWEKIIKFAFKSTTIDMKNLIVWM